MILGDSSFFIGLANRRDRWHRDAVRVSGDLRDRILVTDLVIAEAVTEVGNHVGAKAGMRLYRYFFDDCEVRFVDAALLDAGIQRWLGFDARLSVADAVSVEVMVREGISRVASFDTDFDRIRGIERLH